MPAVQERKNVQLATNIVNDDSARYWKDVNNLAIERSTEEYACTFTSSDSEASIFNILKLARRK